MLFSYLLEIYQMDLRRNSRVSADVRSHAEILLHGYQWRTQTPLAPPLDLPLVMSPRYIAKFPFFNSNTWRHGSTLFDLNGQKLAFFFFSFFRDQLTSPSSICYDCLRYCGFDPVSIISNLKVKGQTAIFKEH